MRHSQDIQEVNAGVTYTTVTRYVLGVLPHDDKHKM